MTTVNISECDKTVVVTIIGHANYNPGNDIVCSAISTIAQTLLQTLHYYESIKQCKVLTEDITDGSVVFSFTTSNKTATDALLNMAKIGFLSLEKSYPDNVKTNVS